MGGFKGIVVVVLLMLFVLKIDALNVGFRSLFASGDGVKDSGASLSA